MFDLRGMFRRRLPEEERMDAGELERMLAEDDTPLEATSGAALKKLREARKTRVSPGVLTVRATGRLPPGQHVVTSFPVLDLGIRPDISTANWHLATSGLVEEEVSFDWAGFSSLASHTATGDFHCVTGWSRFDNRWRGVAAADIVSACRPLPDARFVLLRGADGYTTNLPIEDFIHPLSLLAFEWDGEPLSHSHGGPVRAVVPHLYGWKSAKWLVGIEFLERKKSGFWEHGGYHDRGDPWLGHRFKWNDAAYDPWTHA